jgi:hypothetical protein
MAFPCTREGCKKSYSARNKRQQHERSEHDNLAAFCRSEECRRNFVTATQCRSHELAVHQLGVLSFIQFVSSSSLIQFVPVLLLCLTDLPATDIVYSSRLVADVAGESESDEEPPAPINRRAAKHPSVSLTSPAATRSNNVAAGATPKRKRSSHDASTGAVDDDGFDPERYMEELP